MKHYVKATDVGSSFQPENYPAATGNVNCSVDYNYWTFLVVYKANQVDITNFRSLFKPPIHYKFAFLLCRKILSNKRVIQLRTYICMQSHFYDKISI